MKRYDNFVSPADGELPRLQPLARMPDIEAQDIDAGKLFGRTPIHTHERRDPVTEAYGFMIKYAGLTAILLILAVGLALRLEWNFATGTLAFAGMATGAYWLLSFTESLFTGPGVERLRLTVGGRVLTRQIEADERVRLAQIDLQANQIALQREHNTHTIEAARQRASAQIEAHRTPQDGRNGHDATRSTCWTIDAVETPRFAQGPQTLRTGGARQAILDSILQLYERGDDGQWLNMDEAGYIHNSTPVPWGKRGGYTQTERRAMLDILHRSRLAGFDDDRRAWRVSVTLYPDAQAAIDAVGGVGG